MGQPLSVPPFPDLHDGHADHSIEKQPQGQQQHEGEGAGAQPGAKHKVQHTQQHQCPVRGQHTQAEAWLSQSLGNIQGHWRLEGLAGRKGRGQVHFGQVAQPVVALVRLLDLITELVTKKNTTKTILS